MDRGRVKDVLEKVNALIHEADPVNLGGVEGEYDLQVNEIVKIMAGGHKQFTGPEIRQIFERDFGIKLNDDSSFEKIAEQLNKII